MDLMNNFDMEIKIFTSDKKEIKKNEETLLCIPLFKKMIDDKILIDNTISLDMSSEDMNIVFQYLELPKVNPDIVIFKNWKKENKPKFNKEDIVKELKRSPGGVAYSSEMDKMLDFLFTLNMNQLKNLYNNLLYFEINNENYLIKWFITIKLLDHYSENFLIKEYKNDRENLLKNINNTLLN